ncbi:MAG: 2-oxo acid dehydrogenase subunit E2 [Deltaproteobacteria bacterium]|nr:2-oxo acid dehydrogenase subunit E2 [Deltaproteobacteria bacterium]
MTYQFKLPDLGEGITEGEIVKWRVKAGEAVLEHQVVVEVETDKAIVEVPSPKKGTVIKLNKAEGETVLVGETLLEIEAQGEKPEAKEEKKEKSVSVVGALPEGEEAPASPKARALAKKLGIDLEKLRGTGPGAVITEQDVLSAANTTETAEKRAAPCSADKFGPIERIPIKGVRKSISKNLLASQRTAAFATGMDEADVTDLWDLRNREQRTARDRGVHLTFLPFFIKAVQHALFYHPMLNGAVDEEHEEIIVKKYYNIGVAIDTPDGLMAPVIKNADKLTILEIASELEGLSARAKSRKIALDELKGSTFTLSNYGSFGGTFATPIINYPDVAILGTGRIMEKPWVKDKAITIRKILPLSITFDHRVVDGSQAAQFLTRVIKYLEDPAMIFIESA